MQMAEYGKKIIESRETFIESLGEIICGIHEKLSGGKEELTLSYEKNVGAEELYDAITRSRGAGYPHEDLECGSPPG